MINHVGVVLKPQAKEAVALLQTVRQAFPNLVLSVENTGFKSLDLDANLPGIRLVDSTTFENHVELVLVLGGDGTLIHAASLLPNRLVPILGINLGFVGFLTEVTKEELLDVMTQALEQTLPYTDRLRLDVAALRGEEVLAHKRILNDAVVSTRSLARIATFRIKHNDTLVTSMRGDGVIFSTPTGSTAYGLAAGGPIVWPAIEAITMTPICPHQLTHRPLVMPPDGVFAVTLDSNNTVFASFDGHDGHAMMLGDTMTVRRAPIPTRILSIPWRGYFQTLRTKLRWGED